MTYQESLPLLKRYRENSLPSDSDEMRLIREAARRNKIFVSLGYSELDLASLYITQVMIDPAGNIINHRRKIKATHVERLVFGDGTGDTTESVVDTEIGRVGHLNCWENMNPFLKAYAASLGEQLHVAAWPLYPGQETWKYPDPYTNIAETNADVSGLRRLWGRRIVWPRHKLTTSTRSSRQPTLLRPGPSRLRRGKPSPPTASS